MPDPDPEYGSDTHLEVGGIPSEADVGDPLNLWPSLFDVSPRKYRDPIHVLFESIAEVRGTLELSHVCPPL